jgi:P4 family phage/plasmid primase-like protien
MDILPKPDPSVQSRHAVSINWTGKADRISDNVNTNNAFSPGESGAQNIGCDRGDRFTADEHDIVTELRELLGYDVVLLPVPIGKKGPINEKWQETQLEQMDDDNYIAALRRGNIGVGLGKVSNGLCAIDIDCDAAVQPFLELNPELAGTLRTKGARGAQIWVRITGEYPKLEKIKIKDVPVDESKWGEWRACGGQSIIYGMHPDGMQYQRVVDAQPVEIAFNDIRWPDNLKLPWARTDYDLLVEKYGTPYVVSKKGVLSINDFFFTANFSQKHLVLWETMEKEFYRYNPARGLWEIATEEKLKWDLGMDLKAVADETGVDQFHWKVKDGNLASMVNSLKGAVEKSDVFAKHGPVVHLANGMLDLSVNPPVLKGFDPEHYSRNMCPISLDQEAQCPRFMNELLGVALDDDDIRLLQKWAGSVLVGGNAAQRILLIQGTPNGGKSTLIEIIEKMIGLQNVAQMRTHLLNERFEYQKFLGKTLLTGKDVNGDFLNKEGAENLKSLVGNDLLDAEKKGVNKTFQLRGNFAMAITCNSRLHVRLDGDVGAWQRRLMVVNYTRPKPERIIANFADVLIAEEGAGILNWMIEGAVLYLEDLRGHGTIQLTQEQQKRVELLLAESDSVRMFVNECVIKHDFKDVTVMELQGAYFEYCDEMGWRAFSPTEFKASIVQPMLDIHHVSRRNDIKRGFNGTETHRGFRGVIVGGRGGQ